MRTFEKQKIREKKKKKGPYAWNFPAEGWEMHAKGMIPPEFMVKREMRLDGVSPTTTNLKQWEDFFFFK